MYLCAAAPANILRTYFHRTRLCSFVPANSASDLEAQGNDFVMMRMPRVTLVSEEAYRTQYWPQIEKAVRDVLTRPEKVLEHVSVAWCVCVCAMATSNRPGGICCCIGVMCTCIGAARVRDSAPALNAAPAAAVLARGGVPARVQRVLPAASGQCLQRPHGARQPVHLSGCVSSFFCCFFFFFLSLLFSSSTRVRLHSLTGGAQYIGRCTRPRNPPSSPPSHATTRCSSAPPRSSPPSFTTSYACLDASFARVCARSPCFRTSRMSSRH